MPYGNPNYPYRPRPGTPRRVLRKPYDGGPVALLPVVITLGIGALTDTSMSIVGSVNPNGSPTSWWVTYGTSLPLPGTNTPPQFLGNGTTPLTVTLTVSGLAPATVYYATIVGQSAAGTVFGETVSLISAVAPPSPSPATLQFAQPGVTIPHFNVPFSLITMGINSGAEVVEQDTLDEIFANVKAVADCVIGQCAQIPSFGIPSTTFLMEPIDPTELVLAIQDLEPRATESAVSQLLADGASWGITLTTSQADSQNN